VGWDKGSTNALVCYRLASAIPIAAADDFASLTYFVPN
jgi:hypothetical protein